MFSKIGNFDLERLSPSNLYNSYLGMSGREQTYALVGVVAFLILIIVIPVVVATTKLSSMREQIEIGEGNIKRIVAEIEGYNQMKARYEGLKLKLMSSNSVSIPSVLEGLAEKEGIKDLIDSVKNRTGGKDGELMDEMEVDVRMRKVSLNKLISYLYAIERYPEAKLRLTTLEIRPRYDNKSELNIAFTVSTYQIPEGKEGN